MYRCGLPDAWRSRIATLKFSFNNGIGNSPTILSCHYEWRTPAPSVSPARELPRPDLPGAAAASPAGEHVLRLLARLLRPSLLRPVPPAPARARPGPTPGPAAPGPMTTAGPADGAAAGAMPGPADREQWFEPRSRRQAEAWGSTDPAAPRTPGPARTDGAPVPAAAPGGGYPPPQEAVAPRRDGPPWAEAEPQPEQQSEPRRSASRRGQPRHGRHR